MKNWKIYILLTLSTVIWGSAFIGGKFAIQDFEPMTVAFFRFFGATIILVPLIIIKKQWPKNINLRDAFLFAILGFTGIFVYNFAFFMAAKYAPVIKSSLIIATNPILIVILSGLFLKELITRNQIIGLISASLGALYIITNGKLSDLLALRFEWIDAILLLAVVSWAVYSVLGKVVMNRYSPLVSTTFACLIGTIFLLPFALSETSWSDIQQASLTSWAWIVEMAVLVTVISFVIWYNGIKEIGASKSAIFINAMPLSAVCMATIFLGEQLSLHHLIGAIFIFGGIYLGTKQQRIKGNSPFIARSP